MDETQPVPLPELVDLGAWTVEEAPGDGRESAVLLDALEGRGGTLRVPLGGGARERYIRAHELGHAAWTPREPSPPGIPEGTMQHAEDARIARRLAAIGIRARTRLLSDDEIERTAAGLGSRTRSRLEVASMLLATTGVPDGEVLARAVLRYDPLLPRRVRRIWAATIGRDAKPDFACAVEAAERLIAEFATPGGPGADGVGRAIAGYVVTVGPATPGADKGSSEDDGDPHPGWGDLEIHSFPLPLRLAPELLGRSWRAADEGPRLGDPARFYRDGRGWRARRPRRRAGGTALIDCSGSMAMSDEMLQQLVAANPAALIATYSGNDDQQTGRLHIVARDGRRVRPAHVRPPGIFNVCDGPALDWLGRQRAPRIWVSDGGVTGRGEACTAALIADAEARARRHRISRVESADALLGKWCRDAGFRDR